MIKGTEREVTDQLRQLKHEYRQAFAPGAPAHEALVDLGRWCDFAGNEAIIGNHDVMLILAGRRQAYCRILDHLGLEPDELFDLYKATRKVSIGDA